MKNKYAHNSSISPQALKKLKKDIVAEIEQRTLNLRTEAMMLAFGATLAERGVNEEEIFKILSSADDKMGQFTTLYSLDAFRQHIVDCYNFDVRISSDDGNS